METIGIVLIMLVAVVLSRFVAQVTRLPAPLVQIALGAGIYYTQLEAVTLDPQVFFLLLLPPLLFLDGWRIPKDDLFREAPTIARLALGLVVFTVLGVGAMVHLLIPAMPLSVAFALAAAVSPTDAIAVSAIAARTPLPLRMRRILEGESLFNDASGLVCMRFAVAATLTGSFALGEALASFAWVAAGGLAVGFGATWLVTRAQSWSTQWLGAPDDAGGGAQILMSLLIPFGVYLLAEHLQASGILAAVAAGIAMGMAPHTHWQAITRIRRNAVWDMLQFAANGAVFVLLGEQIPAILAAAPKTVLLTGHDNPWWLGGYVLLIVLALAALRFVWVWVSLKAAFSGTGHAGAHMTGELPHSSHARLVLAMSLAGVRGAITLAGVLTLPVMMGPLTPFPARDLAIALAAGVIVLSLLVATVGLPAALRGLEPAPDTSRRAAEHRLRAAAAEAAILAIEATPAPTGDRAAARLHAAARERIVESYRQRIDRHADASTTVRTRADAVERELRLIGLRAEREEILRSDAEHGVPELTRRKLVQETDLQEARHGS